MVSDQNNTNNKPCLAHFPSRKSHGSEADPDEFRDTCRMPTAFGGDGDDFNVDEFKRAISIPNSRHTAMSKRLHNLFGIYTAPPSRTTSQAYHAQHASRLPSALRRNLLVAAFAACVIAGVLLLSFEAGEQYSGVVQVGSGVRGRYDARLLAHGDAEGGEDGKLEEASSSSSTKSQRGSWRIPGLSRLWGGGKKDGERQLRDSLLQKGEKPRVALLFFGLPRSLPYTMPSIEKHIMRPLRDTGYTPTVFVHTFSGVGVPNAAGEQWRLLEPFDHIITQQQEFLDRRRSDIDACLKIGTGWINWPEANQTKNAQNMVCQLKSIEEVSKLWSQHYAKHMHEYAAVAYVRPDVHYMTPLPTQVIPRLEESDVYVPGWGENKGMNDRFALMHPAAALQWQGRMKYTLKECRSEPIHSETFARSFADSHALTVKKLPCDFVFFRVRATGEIAASDEALPGLPRAKLDLAKQRDLVARRRGGKQKSIAKTPVATPTNSTTPQQRTSSSSQQVAEKNPTLSSGGSNSKAVVQGGWGGAAKAPPQRGVHPSDAEWDNTLAICALMKDEQMPDILEWLGYHRWLGVDKIFLRENGAKVSESISATLEDMVAEGWLELDSWEGQSPEAQQLWYNRCAKPDLAGQFSWILFTDLDEFLVLMDKGEAVEQPHLKEFLKERRGAAGLTLQWIMFGSSGHRDRPQPGGPLSHYSKCSNKLSFEMKCLAASHHLCDVPFIKPTFLHACAYNYNRKELESLRPPVLYGDGTRANDSKIVHMYPPPSTGPDKRTRAQRAGRCRSYAGHLQGDAYNDTTMAIPKGPTLVLFHYMTRSWTDFSERKLSRYAGMYVDEFREKREAASAAGGKTPSDEEIFDDLEARLRIGLEAPVCESAAAARYASRCCDL